jgi:hypothetical protein
VDVSALEHEAGSEFQGTAVLSDSLIVCRMPTRNSPAISGGWQASANWICPGPTESGGRKGSWSMFSVMALAALLHIYRGGC